MVKHSTFSNDDEMRTLFEQKPNEVYYKLIEQLVFLFGGGSSEQFSVSANLKK